MAKERVINGPSLEDAQHGDSVDLASAGGQASGATEPEWLRLARDAHSVSTRWFDNSIRPQLERNQRMFQSRHPPGSKYFSDTYKARSKIFRPKTRAMVRAGEAQAAASYFSNPKVVTVEAADDSDPMQLASARVNQQLLQYRLTNPNPRVSIPWFQTVVGAYQSAQVDGYVASKQWWEYVERKTGEREEIMKGPEGVPMLSEAGEPIMQIVEEFQVVFDRPRCDLIPPENIRIDPAASWVDPVSTSPYVIIEWPMYVFEVEAKAKEIDHLTGQPKFLTVDRSVMMSASTRQTYDSTRQQRENRREDSKTQETPITEFSIVWVHENFIKYGGEDWVFHTAGVHALLSTPRPVSEAYPHCGVGERPIVMGSCIVEAHKVLPSGKPQLSAGLQDETNDLANLRLDNVKLAINKRMKVRRGRQTDLHALVRGVPGAVVLVQEMDDVEELDVRDVTQSAFMEQDRINVDMDEVLGNFSSGSVQTNRRLNETVGGMSMLRGAATLVSELDLRVFSVTWAQPALSQIVRLEQMFESDEKILALAAKKAQQHQRFRINQVTDELLMQSVTTIVNVGIGATDPMQRLEKLFAGLKMLVEIYGPQVVMILDVQEIVEEIFSVIGYMDGMRFFKFDDEDPAVKILKAQIEELKKLVEGKQMEVQGKLDVSKMQALARVLSQAMTNEGETQAASIKAGANLKQTEMKAEADFRKEFMKLVMAPKPEPANGTKKKPAANA